jgi:hypothetical protein
MGNSDAEKETPVHLQRGGAWSWYNTSCGVKGTDIYVTANRNLVTCERCKER